MADIELVIKIPEEIYIHSLSRYKYQNANDIGLSESDKVGIAVKNGILLPKGHGRLVDADDTISKICGNSCGCHLEECGRDVPCFSVTRIGSALTIIEADKAESEEI